MKWRFSYGYNQYFTLLFYAVNGRKTILEIPFRLYDVISQEIFVGISVRISDHMQFFSSAACYDMVHRAQDLETLLKTFMVHKVYGMS
jgi:hypothetical protein